MSEIFRTHAFSAARGLVYGVGGTVVTLGTAVTVGFSPVATAVSATFVTGCALTWKTLAHKSAPVTGVIASMFGGVACAGALVLGAATLLGVDYPAPKDNKPAGLTDIKAVPAPTKPLPSPTII